MAEAKAAEEVKPVDLVEAAERAVKKAKQQLEWAEQALVRARKEK